MTIRDPREANNEPTAPVNYANGKLNIEHFTVWRHYCRSHVRNPAKDASDADQIQEFFFPEQTRKPEIYSFGFDLVFNASQPFNIDFGDRVLDFS